MDHCSNSENQLDLPFISCTVPFDERRLYFVAFVATIQKGVAMIFFDADECVFNAANGKSKRERERGR